MLLTMLTLSCVFASEQGAAEAAERTTVSLTALTTADVTIFVGDKPLMVPRGVTMADLFEQISAKMEPHVDNDLHVELRNVAGESLGEVTVQRDARVSALAAAAEPIMGTRDPKLVYGSTELSYAADVWRAFGPVGRAEVTVVDVTTAAWSHPKHWTLQHQQKHREAMDLWAIINDKLERGVMVTATEQQKMQTAAMLVKSVLSAMAKLRPAVGYPDNVAFEQLDSKLKDDLVGLNDASDNTSASQGRRGREERLLQRQIKEAERAGDGAKVDELMRRYNNLRTEVRTKRR